MGRKKKMLELPAQAGKDLKTVTGIFDRWAVGAEDVIKDLFAWAKRHKILVAVIIAAIAMKRYWLDEGEEPEDENFD